MNKPTASVAHGCFFMVGHISAAAEGLKILVLVLVFIGSEVTKKV